MAGRVDRQRANTHRVVPGETSASRTDSDRSVGLASLGVRETGRRLHGRGDAHAETVQNGCGAEVWDPD